MKRRYDLLILGSGFAGSLLALIARKLGKSVALLEPGKHPRFAIGESSTPLANLLLEELSARYSLDRIQPLSKWGTWQKHYPELACGLKRGFTFFHHDSKGDVKRFLVAASPNDRFADTHWFREQFDLFILNEAIAAGADYFDQVTIREMQGGSVVAGGTVFEGGFIIDGSGPRGILHRVLNIEESQFSNFPATKAVFSHFVNVPRSNNSEAIYPVDDAAVHHIFDAGWVWVLRFNNGITSAGAAIRETFGKDCKNPEQLWQAVLQCMPNLQEAFQHAVPVQPFRYLPKLSFRASKAVGDNWLMLPSAAGFVDPLLSTGFPLTLLGVKRIATWLENGMPNSFLSEYEEVTFSELDFAADLISALYSSFDDFEQFKSLSLLYFGAASFSETALRLGKRELAGDKFLLSGNSAFAKDVRRICESARNKECVVGEIQKAIEPFDAAGLCGERIKEAYPVDFADLYANAWKFNASKAEVDAMLRRVGCLP